MPRDKEQGSERRVIDLGVVPVNAAPSGSRMSKRGMAVQALSAKTCALSAKDEGPMMLSTVLSRQWRLGDVLDGVLLMCWMAPNSDTNCVNDKVDKSVKVSMLELTV